MCYNKNNIKCYDSRMAVTQWLRCLVTLQIGVRFPALEQLKKFDVPEDEGIIRVQRKFCDVNKC